MLVNEEGVSKDNEQEGVSMDSIEEGVAIGNNEEGVSKDNEQEGVSMDNIEEGVAIGNNEEGVSKDNEQESVTINNNEEGATMDITEEGMARDIVNNVPRDAVNITATLFALLDKKDLCERDHNGTIVHLNVFYNCFEVTLFWNVRDLTIINAHCSLKHICLLIMLPRYQPFDVCCSNGLLRHS